MMKKGILACPENLGNIEVWRQVNLLSSPKVTASRSFCPSKGTQVLADKDRYLLGLDCRQWPEPISLWRETGFSSTEIQREDRVRKGRKAETGKMKH
jgi:hypothetical protein